MLLVASLGRNRFSRRALRCEMLEDRRVLAENQPPINTVPPPQQFTSENPTVEFGAVNGVSTVDFDAGSQPLRMTLFVNNGTITLPTTTGLTFLNGANGSRYLLFDGSQTAINNALFGMTYRANSGTNSDVLTVDTHDLGHTGTGGAKVDRDTIQLTRSDAPNQPPVNQLPAAQFFTNENRTVSFSGLSRISTADPDAGNLPLRMTLFVNNGTLHLGTTAGLTFRSGANGTRYLLFDGTQEDINNALLNLTYTANAGANSDLLTVDTHDLGHTGTGGAKVDRDSLTISRIESFPNLPPVNVVPPGQFYSNANPTVTFGELNPIATFDPDAGNLPVRVTLFVNSGTLTLGTTSGLSFLSGANGTRYLLFDGTLNDVNNALFGLTYRANAGSNSDVLTIDVHDLGHTGSGGARVDRDTVTLTRVNTLGFSTNSLATNSLTSSGVSGVTAASQTVAATSLPLTGSSITPLAAATTDAVMASPALPTITANQDSALRLADLLASTNAGRIQTESATDQVFSEI